MAKSKKATVRSKPAATKPAAKKRTAATKKKRTAAKAHPFNDKRPDAGSDVLAAHARALAVQVRTDATALKLAKVVPADATKLEALADTLDAAHEAWTAIDDARGKGAVATARTPLRKGRDQMFNALRTFADGNADTASTLNDIAGVTSDDDLVLDTTRLLVLAKRHRKDLDGTNVTVARVDEVRKLLAAFKKARAGARTVDSKASTAQAQTDAALVAQRARNHAFWTLATLDRQVCKRAQHAFRDDAKKRAKYFLYHDAAVTPAPKPIVGTPVT